jgi:hypothetical protein
MLQDLSQRFHNQSRRLTQAWPGSLHWPPLWLLAPLLISASLVLSGLALAFEHPLISVENGPIENGQAALIAMAIGFNVWNAVSIKQRNSRV